MKVNWLKVGDFVERVSATFAFTFLGSVLAPGFHATDKHALYAALIGGGLSAGKFAYVELNLYLNSASTT
jgi:hypothetical protein